MTMKSQALILGSSKGIGKAALNAALNNDYYAETISSKDVNTQSSQSIIDFSSKYKSRSFDLILLNSGGLPPAKISKNNESVKIKQPLIESINAHTLGYAELLENLNINNNCLILHVSSHVVMNKEGIMFASAVARSAMESLVNYLPLIYPKLSLTCINLRFGPVLTDRFKNLLANESVNPEDVMKELKATSKSPISVNQLEKFFEYLYKDGRYIHGSSTLNLDSGINSNLCVTE